MTKLNPQFTTRLSRFLALAQLTDADRREGAELLLAATRDHALYSRCMARPRQMESFMLYRLRKILNVRLAGLTMAEVRQMDEEVVPKVREAVEASQQAAAADTAAATDTPSPAQKAGGRRPDHDSLPDAVKQLWDDCARLWPKIVMLYNTLLSLDDAPPCDRYEHLAPLKKMYYDYLDKMRRYDDYTSNGND